MSFKVYLRSHAPDEVGRIDPESRTNTADARVAVKAYRELLARDDLEGQPWAAVLSVPRGLTTGGGRSLYFSRFDRPFGLGRIHPDAPIDAFADPEKAEQIAKWQPSGPVHDWENDPRPFGECLKAWHASHNWTRDQAAEELRMPRSTYDSLCSGRKADREAGLRRLMTLIDRLDQ